MKNFHFYLQKEEMGEVLHEVDFNQLKIENQQYLEKIDEKNQDLLRLKLMSTNVQQILNTYKVRKSSLAPYLHKNAYSSFQCCYFTGVVFLSKPLIMFVELTHL